MPSEIPIGASHEVTSTVTQDMSPPHLVGVGVLSTPAMIQLMEQCALALMARYLTDEETSVGTEVCITHDAALRVGEDVTVKARLAEMQGRRYVWEVEAFGPDGKRLGGGTHKRAVINAARLRGG